MASVKCDSCRFGDKDAYWNSFEGEDSEYRVFVTDGTDKEIELGVVVENNTRTRGVGGKYFGKVVFVSVVIVNWFATEFPVEFELAKTSSRGR